MPEFDYDLFVIGAARVECVRHVSRQRKAHVWQLLRKAAWGALV